MIVLGLFVKIIVIILTFFHIVNIIVKKRLTHSKKPSFQKKHCTLHAQDKRVCGDRHCF